MIHLKVIDNNVGDNLDFQTKDGVRYRTEEIGDLSFNTTSQIPAREPVLKKNTKPIDFILERFTIKDNILVMIIKIFEKI